MATINYTPATINNILGIANNYVAAPYNTATSYKVGDYCSRSGKVYRCKTATSGTWSSSRWEEVVIGDELAGRDVYSAPVNTTNAVNVATGADFTEIQTMALDAGVWLVYGAVSFAANATGYRQMGLSTSTPISVSRHEPNQQAAPATSSTNMNMMRVFQLTAAGTVYLLARQTSGSTLAVQGSLQAIKLR